MLVSGRSRIPPLGKSARGTHCVGSGKSVKTGRVGHPPPKSKSDDCDWEVGIMRRMLRWIVAAGSTFLALRLITYVFPEALCVLLSYLLLLALLVFLGVSVATGVTRWRNTTRAWFLPTLICMAYILIGLSVMPSIGPTITDWLFVKNVDAYSRVADDFRKGKISCTRSCTGEMELIQVASRPARVSRVWGVHCDDGGAILLFLSDTDVPLLHEGFFFKDFEVNSNCAREFLSPERGWPHAPFIRHIVGQWYHFSDQPGL
jgi:hypothetical protein